MNGTNQPPANNSSLTSTGDIPLTIDADLIDAIADAAITLSGIAEALAYRVACSPDDLLEFLANAAEAQAATLRGLDIFGN